MGVKCIGCINKPHILKQFVQVYWPPTLDCRFVRAGWGNGKRMIDDELHIIVKKIVLKLPWKLPYVSMFVSYSTKRVVWSINIRHLSSTSTFFAQAQSDTYGSLEAK